MEIIAALHSQLQKASSDLAEQQRAVSKQSDLIAKLKHENEAINEEINKQKSAVEVIFSKKNI